MSLLINCLSTILTTTIMLDITTENPYFGESRIEYQYNCFRCCYCDRLAPTLNEQEDKIVSNPPPITTAYQDKIAAHVGTKDKVWDRGYNLDYMQVIHFPCMAKLTTYQKDIIRRKNRNNIILPSMDDPTLSKRLNYDALALNPVQCIRCAITVDWRRQGLSFGARQNRHYIHYNCYTEIENFHDKQYGVLEQFIKKNKVGDGSPLRISITDKYSFVNDHKKYFLERLQAQGYITKEEDVPNILLVY